MKIGLSNIVVMYTLFPRQKGGYLVGVLKALFVFITRGMVAGILSLGGGVLSITVMVLLMIVFKEHISYFILSIAGAVFHNLGQLAAVSLLYTNMLFIVHLPILLISGVVAGTVTATLLRVFLPAFKSWVWDKPISRQTAGSL